MNYYQKNNIYIQAKETEMVFIIYLAELSSGTTHVDRPQNGLRSHCLPGSNIAHFVEAKQTPGKSTKTIIIK